MAIASTGGAGPHSRPLWFPPAIIISTIYFGFALAIAGTKAPWVDEGWVSYPAYNLARTGSTGTSMLEPTGTILKGELKGIRQRTYWIMPLPILIEALWFRVFGYSILSARSFSICWGAVALLSWFTIVRLLSRNLSVALLASLLLATDFSFLWGAADGRMDIMCVALGSAGLAAYLLLRDRNLTTALLVSNCCVVGSIFSHPYGVLWVAALALAVVWTDWRRLRLKHFLFVTPYVAGFALWTVYILQDPSSFAAQIGANAQGGTRWVGFSHPFRAIRYEILGRYVAQFGHPWDTDHPEFSSWWSGPVPKSDLAIPLIYLASIVFALLRPSTRNDRSFRLLLALFLLHFAFLTFADGHKVAQHYLLHIIPLCPAVFAMAFSRGWARGAGLALALALLVLQVRTSVQKIHDNEYHNSYLPVVNWIAKRAQPDSSIMGASTFIFPLLGRRLTDDLTLGYFSHKRPDYVLIDAYYRRMWDGDGNYPATHRDVYKHVESILTESRCYGRDRFVVCAVPSQDSNSTDKTGFQNASIR